MIQVELAITWQPQAYALRNFEHYLGNGGVANGVCECSRALQDSNLRPAGS